MQRGEEEEEEWEGVLRVSPLINLPKPAILHSQPEPLLYHFIVSDTVHVLPSSLRQREICPFVEKGALVHYSPLSPSF